jgi:hypothetical protein
MAVFVVSQVGGGAQPAQVHSPSTYWFAAMSSESPLSDIPTKSRFTLGEVCHLCGVTSQELYRVAEDYPLLKLKRRRGHRPVYERDEVLLLRAVLELLRAKGVDLEGESTAEEVSEGLSSQQLHEELLAIRNSLLD